jgi:hypothetical protein
MELLCPISILGKSNSLKYLITERRYVFIPPGIGLYTWPAEIVFMVTNPVYIF